MVYQMSVIFSIAIWATARKDLTPSTLKDSEVIYIFMDVPISLVCGGFNTGVGRAFDLYPFTFYPGLLNL
jgi:hypothetical protein